MAGCGGGAAGACVAPLAGAWIEIEDGDLIYVSFVVAPLAGAWIEIRSWQSNFGERMGRTPRGCVD